MTGKAGQDPADQTRYIAMSSRDDLASAMDSLGIVDGRRSHELHASARKSFEAQRKSLETSSDHTAAGPDEELERFRREWQAEVKAKKGAPASSSTTVPVGSVQWKREAPQTVTTSTSGVSKSPERTITSPKAKVKSPINPRSDPPAESSGRLGSELTSLSPTGRDAATADEQLDQYKTVNHARVMRKAQRVENAVDIYAQAVESEQSGQLSEALQLYRRAFKLNDSVDKLYARSRLKAMDEAQAQAEATPTSTDVVSASAPEDAPYSFQRHIQVAPDYENKPVETTTASRRPSPLTKLFDAHPDITSRPFEPADENLPFPIDSLPPELLENVFAHLDVAALENFAMTCWRARWLTAKSDVWKKIVMGLYRPPGMLSTSYSWVKGKIQEEIATELARRHAREWRTVMLEEERVRLDGCYIAVCHYVRPGAGDQWVTVTHMITYHRFLRFYPDGSVISFLTTDHPAEVVPVLRPSLRDAQSPPDGKPNERPRPKIRITSLLEPGAEPKYEFEMDLELRETARGRWNKLDLLSYRSINLANGEVLGLALKHQRPFYFSKVRSYHPPL